MRARFEAVRDFINREGYGFGSPPFIAALASAGWTPGQYSMEWVRRENFAIDMHYAKGRKLGKNAEENERT